MKRFFSFLAALFISVPAASAVDEATKSTPEFEKLMADGQKIYIQNCLACHQMTGQGLPATFPPLVGSDWLNDDDRIIRIVLHGLQGEITVNGAKYNNIMVPYGIISFPLDDKQIATVLSYVRNSWGNSGNLISHRRVAQVREATKDRTTQYTVEELLEAHPLKSE